MAPTDLSFFRSKTSQRLRDEGRSQGLAKGLAQGVEVGLAKGLAQGHADGVLRILDKRGIDVPEDVRGRVTSCTDEATIDAWYDRALTATTAEDLFRES